MNAERTHSVKLYRYDPSFDKEPYYEQFIIPHQKGMRVLDALDYIYEQLEHPFAYHWFCGTKRCGMCSVMVNGKPSLACWEAAHDHMIVEPLRHFPIIRDLVVDFSENEKTLTELRPQPIRKAPYEGFPENLSAGEMQAHLDLMSCIDCRLCVAACPKTDPADPTYKGFVGPYTLVQLAKVGVDPRFDIDLTQSLLKGRIQDCGSCNDCGETCPNQIPILKGAIDKLRDRLVDDGVYKIRAWNIIKKLPLSLRKWSRCKLNLTLGERMGHQHS